MSSAGRDDRDLAASAPVRRRGRSIGVRVVLVFGSLLIATVALFFAVTSNLPDTREIRAIGDNARVTTIFDARDRPLFPVYKEERIDIPLAKVSPDLVHAVVAVEDEHFYHHAGFDAPRIA